MNFRSKKMFEYIILIYSSLYRQSHKKSFFFFFMEEGATKARVPPAHASHNAALFLVFLSYKFTCRWQKLLGLLKHVLKNYLLKLKTEYRC